MYYLTEAGKIFVSEETERQTKARDIKHQRAFSGDSGKLGRRAASQVEQLANMRKAMRTALAAIDKKKKGTESGQP